MKALLLSVLVSLAFAGISEAREANRLRGSDSPYLLQHQFNPVDWYPWGEEALKKAKTENKPIFVSVGYSSCHWCHVMERESFEDMAIARQLNEGFVSIKIDRESRPDLDEQFILVTQLLTGSSGWPNSVFLTPEGEPYFAGGYFPPDVFQSVLSRVHQAWQENPEFVSKEARRVSQSVRDLLARRAKAGDINPGSLGQAVASILRETDPFNGGYGVAPKFPRESLYLFLLDQAERTGAPDALNAVAEMLDGMILGGVHDHVGGGFHRYSVSPDWNEPHFEKVLYTQALMGRLLVRTWGATGAIRYRRAAERLFDYVLRDMRDPGGGFYSAQDADSPDSDGSSTEGAYYTWTRAEIAALVDERAMDPNMFRLTSLNGDDDQGVLGLQQFPAVTDQVDGFLRELLARRGARPRPFLDRKIVVSWNALMIATLAEAAHHLKRPDYYEAAEQAALFILDTMRAEDGLFRVSFDGSAQIPGQLPDDAAMGLALIALHDYTPGRPARRDWQLHARKLADGIRRKFGPMESGLRMTKTRDGLGDLIPIDDTEIPSGNALALSLFARLAHRIKVPDIAVDADSLAAALSGNAIAVPEQRAFSLKAIEELRSGETGPVRHAGHGAVRTEFRRLRQSGSVSVSITVADGWHINAHKPLEDHLIATNLRFSGAPGVSVTYPDPVIKSLSISDMPLALYEGHLEITANGVPDNDSGDAGRVTLQIQACSDEICLQPEELSFVLWPERP